MGQDFGQGMAIRAMRKEYFQPLFVNGQRVDLSHLDPFTMTLFSDRLNKHLRIAVTFSTHCFSESYGVLPHPLGDTLIDEDTKWPRTYCPIRYGLSKALPGVINGLPGQLITRTIFKRNWLHTLTIAAPAGPYHVFVELQKASPERRTWQDLELVVESAYHQTGEPPGVSGGPRAFMAVCADTYAPPRKKPAKKRK